MTPYYNNDGVILYHGNCLQVLPEINKTVDAVISDPPYGTTCCKWDSVIPLDSLWKCVNRVTRDTTPVVLFSAQPFTSVLVTSNLQNFRYDWIWEKSEVTGHLNSKKMPMRAHESICVFYKRLPTYNPIKTNGHTRKTATRLNTKSDCYGVQVGVSSYDSTDRYPRSVLKFSTDKQVANLHPTQKPLDLLRYLIRTYTNEGDTVLDFACGSGTTLLAAQLEDRKAIGIELEENYCEVTARRLEEALKRNVVVA